MHTHGHGSGAASWQRADASPGLGRWLPGPLWEGASPGCCSVNVAIGNCPHLLERGGATKEGTFMGRIASQCESKMEEIRERRGG